MQLESNGTTPDGDLANQTLSENDIHTRLIQMIIIRGESLSKQELHQINRRIWQQSIEVTFTQASKQYQRAFVDLARVELAQSFFHMFFTVESRKLHKYFMLLIYTCTCSVLNVRYS